MSVTGPHNVGGYNGQLQQLHCKVNIPLRDVQLEWIKMYPNGTWTSLYGHFSDFGSYYLRIFNATSKDEAVYYCTASYSIGEFSRVEMEHIYFDPDMENAGSSS